MVDGLRSLRDAIMLYAYVEAICAIAAEVNTKMAVQSGEDVPVKALGMARKIYLDEIAFRCTER